MYKAVRQSYECLANDTLDPFLGKGGAEAMMKAAQKIVGLREAAGDRAPDHEGLLPQGTIRISIACADRRRAVLRLALLRRNRQF